MTPPEAADPNLLFFLSCCHLLSGSISATVTASPLNRFCRERIAAAAEWRLSVACFVPGKEADGGEHTDMLGRHGPDRSPMKQGSDPMPRDLGF